MSAQNRAIIDNKDTLAERAAMPEVSFPVPTYVDDPRLNSGQVTTDLMDKIAWSYYHVMDLSVNQSGHAQDQYDAHEFLSKLKKYQQKLSFFHNDRRAFTT